jgi:hypothetical protein
MEPEQDPMEVLTCVGSEMEAMVVVNALEQYGIKALATSGFTSGMKAEAPTDVEVYVLHSAREEAQQILSDLRSAPTEEDITSPEEEDER